MTRYPTPLIALHWLTALAVITAYITSGNPAEAKNSLDYITGQTHVLSGLAVFALLALRLPLRLLLGTPPAEPVSRWQQRAAGVTHFALYGLMLLVPLAGWAALAQETDAFTLGGGVSLPLLDAHLTWVELLGEAHQTLGNIFIWLAGLHAVAALAHHYVLRDATLVRMAPLSIFKRRIR
ncbi:MAG: cytochrome b [Thiobacillus sp.]